MIKNKKGCGKTFERNSYNWICGRGMKGAILEDIQKPLCLECLGKPILKTTNKCKISNQEKTLNNIILSLRRYLPSQESTGTMDYWLGDNKKNRGIYVDLGAIMGHLKDAIEKFEKIFKGIDEDYETEKTIDKYDHGWKDCKDFIEEEFKEIFGDFEK